jgi:hypothetical protein
MRCPLSLFAAVPLLGRTMRHNVIISKTRKNENRLLIKKVRCKPELAAHNFNI